jgi:hypothetical protein
MVRKENGTFFFLYTEIKDKLRKSNPRLTLNTRIYGVNYLEFTAGYCNSVLVKVWTIFFPRNNLFQKIFATGWEQKHKDKITLYRRYYILVYCRVEKRWEYDKKEIEKISKLENKRLQNIHIHKIGEGK